MSGKSKEEIAFELVSKLKGVGVWGENNMVQILDMYAQCLEATSGLREVDGRKASAVRLAEAESGTANAAAATAPRQAAPAPRQAAPAPRQAAAPQPQVRQQQEQLQQAFQQQVPQVR